MGTRDLTWRTMCVCLQRQSMHDSTCWQIGPGCPSMEGYRCVPTVVHIPPGRLQERALGSSFNAHCSAISRSAKKRFFDNDCHCSSTSGPSARMRSVKMRICSPTHDISRNNAFGPLLLYEDISNLATNRASCHLG